jgi:hypothetical protein
VEIVELANAGHAPLEERGPELVPRIARFFGRVEGRA